MQQIEVATWKRLEEELRSLQSAQTKVSGPGHVSSLLYRGQADSNWELTTTLERCGIGGCSLRQYHRVMSAVRPQVESLTGAVWSVPDVDEYDAWLRDRRHLAVEPPGYAYMIYLRHHGFPSPLLDWTRSPYVGAYFAFRHLHHDAKYVAIFVYREYLGHSKSWESAKPHLHRLGPSVRTHPRHVLQQSEYTICVVRDTEWRYARHEDAFAGREAEQDALWKFRIPSEERLKVLRFLDNANVNTYSLFGTEEALMETLAFRELESGDEQREDR